MNLTSILIKTLLVGLSILYCDIIFAGGSDTCMINDDCENATLILNVISDQSFVCINSCNEYAAPDPIVSACQMGDFPTVWYKVVVDSSATIINIEVHSSDFDAPSISLFKSNSGCTVMEQVYLSNGNLLCIIGSQGVAKAIGTYVTGATTYYIAVSSLYSIGGDFEICVSTISRGSYCVLDRGIEVVSRSNGGPLEGPFDPGEKLRVCLDVNQFTAANNGCQWFQGIVPTFGNGWDPSSFDSIGQPYNATVNNNVMGEMQNGIYGSATWDWFNDVGYHHDHSSLKIVDLDNNGRFELCNSVYEMECQSQDTIKGGCCGPCWENPGDILPGGWFAYGINGSCASPGPPISVDWGDGNSCGGTMGPWKFCYDVVTRGNPDCLGDSTKNDLTLGFYTFADGEIGSWTGGASVCAYDQPLKISLKAQCGKVTRNNPEQLADLNSGDVFTYQIDDRDVSYWEWNISPFAAMPHVTNSGENGVVIEHQVYNDTGEPIDVSIIFIGHETGSEDLIIKKVVFRVNPWTTGTSSVYDNKSLIIYPNPANTSTTIEWPEGLSEIKYLTIYNSQGIAVKQISISSPEAKQEKIDLRNFSAGLYFVNLVTQNKIYTARLIRI